jgi:hypothetical protein
MSLLPCICICIYQGCCFTSHNLFADTNKDTHIILISDVWKIYYVVENNQPEEPEEMFSSVHLMTHCGRKKEMNDPCGTNLPSHTHTHIYHTVHRDVWECVCVVIGSQCIN